MMTHKELIRTPLEQAMALLWLAGLAHILARFAESELSFAWSNSAALAGFIAALICARFNKVQWLALPILLELGAFLVFLNLIGTGPSGLSFASTAFSLLLWQTVNYAMNQPAMVNLAVHLGTSGRQEARDSRSMIIHTTHWTTFFIILGSVVYQLSSSGLGSETGDHSLIVLLTFLVSLIFLWLSGHIYQQILQSYILLIVALSSALELVSLTVHPFSFGTITFDLYAGPFFVISGLMMCALSYVLQVRSAAGFQQESFDNSLFRKPLCIMSILLLLFGFGLQTKQVFWDAGGLILPLNYITLFLSVGGLLFTNHLLRWRLLNHAAILVLIIALMWLESSIMHPGSPFSLWPDKHSFTDQWFTLSALALILSVFSNFLNRYPQWAHFYRQPLNTTATLSYCWALLGITSLFLSAPFDGNPFLPWLFLTLFAGIFPLSKPFTLGPQIRGAGTACLLTLTVICFVALGKFQFSIIPLSAIIWGYILWIMAGFFIPRFNKYIPNWSIQPATWPWLGLVLVLSGCTLYGLSATPLQWGYNLLALFGYFLLMQGFSTWILFPQGAAFFFTAAGIAFNLTLLENLSEISEISDKFPLIFSIGTLAWANLQLLLVNYWKKKGPTLIRHFHWREQGLSEAFEFCSFMIFGFWLLVLLFLNVTTYTNSFPAIETSDWLIRALTGSLLSLSLLHFLHLRFLSSLLHGLFLTIFLSVWPCYLAFAYTLFRPPLLFALWSGLFLLALYVIPRFDFKNSEEIETTLLTWLRFGLIASILSLLIHPAYSVSEQFVTFATLTGLTALLGLWRRQSLWFLIACTLFFLTLHQWPLLFVNLRDIDKLIPWYALQTSAIAWIFYGILGRLSTVENNNVPVLWRSKILRQTLNCWPWLMALSVMELMVHGVLTTRIIYAEGTPQWLLGSGDAAAELGAGLLVITMGIRHAKTEPDSNWIYAVAILAGGLGFYLRLLIAGAAPVSLWDTSLLIAASYSLFFLQRTFPSRPLLNLALIMPLSALVTVPLQLNSPGASTTLLLTGILYLLIRRESQRQLPLYLALLTFNVGIYLWIPAWAERTDLIQVYVIPACLSLLVLIHLHRRELKRSVLMGARLAVTSTIYACATLDVFLLPNLSVFVLALVLSMAGVVLGIALRIRAFLYAGVSFLILNVLGQLLRFYPEQILGKAVVLMSLGTVIICLMIWFNIKREKILQKIQLIRTDLRTWE